MGARRTFVIVGAGFAGALAAQTLREEGFDGRVVLVGDEPARPYDHVPLSKQYLLGKPGLHRLFVHDDGYYAENGIELLRADPAVAIDSTAHRVILASGTRIGWDALLLATGSAARRFHGDGADLARVHYLRTLADADRLRATLGDLAARAGRVAVVGSGWIGCEIASAARQLGVAVALVSRSELPLERPLGREMATFYRDLHTEHGVTVFAGRTVVALRGAGSVREVRLSDGNAVAVDAVVFGIAAAARVELAAAAGLAVDGGIVTDGRFRTSAAGIFAAGDVASVWNDALGRRTRFEHWAAALKQGPAAARSMLGARQPYSQIPFFFSDQYDVWMEFTGEVADGDDLVVRHCPGNRAFIACWLRAGRLAAAMNVNVHGVPDIAGALIAGGRHLDRAALADPDIPLQHTVLAS